MAIFQNEEECKRVIVEKCNVDNATHKRGRGIFTCDLESITYQVKYGVSNDLVSRIANQDCLYDAAAREAVGIRIPGLLYHFDRGGKTYLVMEHIQLVKVPPSEMDEKIAGALTWLSCLAASDVGPLGGGCILHSFFESDEAPVPFKTVKALELYIDKGRTRAPGRGRNLEPVKFKKEPLMFVQGNIDYDHFGVDTQGNTVIMGLRSISRLPQSFARYTLDCSYNSFFAELATKLGWAGASNINTMVEVSAILGKTSNPTLGLNEYGEPASPVKPNAANNGVEGKVGPDA